MYENYNFPLCSVMFLFWLFLNYVAIVVEGYIILILGVTDLGEFKVVEGKGIST